jgi:hypothetical protein
MRHLPGPAICHSCRRLPDRHLHGAQNSAGNLLAGRGVLPPEVGRGRGPHGPNRKAVPELQERRKAKEGWADWLACRIRKRPT